MQSNKTMIVNYAIITLLGAPTLISTSVVSRVYLRFPQWHPLEAHNRSQELCTKL